MKEEHGPRCDACVCHCGDEATGNPVPPWQMNTTVKITYAVIADRSQPVVNWHDVATTAKPEDLYDWLQRQIRTLRHQDVTVEVDTDDVAIRSNFNDPMGAGVAGTWHLYLDVIYPDSSEGVYIIRFEAQDITEDLSDRWIY